MSKKELEAKIEILERERWLLSMKDRWSADDSARDRRMWADIERYKREIERLDS